jgi:predicted HicB family RNase H-like nuclease
VSSHLEYKGYLGSAEIDVEGAALVGKLLFIRDTITYSALTVPDLEKAFREAVDDYLAACAEDGSQPDVPCKGSFNVRVGPLRHREIALAARGQNIGLNDFICLALDREIGHAAVRTIVHKHEVSVVGMTSDDGPSYMTAFTAGEREEEASGGTASH